MERGLFDVATPATVSQSGSLAAPQKSRLSVYVIIGACMTRHFAKGSLPNGGRDPTFTLPTSFIILNFLKKVPTDWIFRMMHVIA